jgi:hypothetical protein
LKLGFSHAKGLWHYKYRSRGKKKRGRIKEKTQEKAIAETLQKKIKIDIYK